MSASAVEDDSPARVGGTCMRMLAAGAVGGAAFVFLLGHRSDYAGHFLAGYGGTLGLLAFPLARWRSTLRWEPLGAALVAIAIGAAMEATIFRLAIFDPVDFCNQSLGAVLAAAAVQDRPTSLGAAFGAGAFALLFLVAGGLFAFA